MNCCQMADPGARPLPPPPRALLLSFPQQGHVTPLMQLARRLARHGFLITFVLSDHTSARSPRSPAAAAAAAQNQFPDEESMRIQIVALPDGLPPDYPRDRDFLDQQLAMEGMRAPVEELLRADAASPSPITCIISDVFVSWSFDVAQALRLPLVALYTATATSCSVLYHARELLSKGILPFDDDDFSSDKRVACIPGVLSLRPAEFPPSMQARDTSNRRFEFTLKMFEHIHQSVGLLLNTAYELEPKAIDALREKFPVFPVGPLLLPTDADEGVPTEPAVSFWQEEDQCIAWLDKQPPSSVLYVSFGSVSTYSAKQFQELALGLEASQQPFLWVVRRDSIPCSLSKALPEGFIQRTKGQGLIVSWAPQLRVLAHAGVGGFLTHCGWNSILEAMSIGGIPMLCWPDIADQMVNRRLVVDDWKIGLEFTAEGVVGREEVEEVVRRLLRSDEGRESRKRAADLKDMVRRCVKEGGSSFCNVEAFVESLIDHQQHRLHPAPKQAADQQLRHSSASACLPPRLIASS